MATTSSTSKVTVHATATGKYDVPEAALQRLDLEKPLGREFLDVLQMSSTQVDASVRQLDAERQTVQDAYSAGNSALDQLKTVSDNLDQIKTLVAANAKSGVGPSDRARNQLQIDDLVKTIGKTLASKSENGQKLFTGKTNIAAAGKNVQIHATSLDTLGRRSLNGKSVSLGDVVTGGALDTSKHTRSATDGATHAVNDAIKQVDDLQKSLTSLTTEVLRPRLGDIAEVMSDIFSNVTSTQLGNSDDAALVLNEVRNLTISSDTAAVAVGADGWDKDRVLVLLGLSDGTSSSASSSSGTPSSSSSTSDTTSST